MSIRLFKTVAPFLAAFFLSVFLVNAFELPSIRKSPPQAETKSVAASTWSKKGYGSSGPADVGRPQGAKPVEEPRGPNAPLQIISKPQAKYTDEARVNNVQGKVRLKVVMLASGQVGTITVVEGLPDGLNEQAIEAARKLRFEPATKNGVPVSKVITIDYSFTTIY